MSNDILTQKYDILMNYYNIIKYWIKDEFYLKEIKSGVETKIKYSFLDFCDKEIDELIRDILYMLSIKKHGKPNINLETKELKEEYNNHMSRKKSKNNKRASHAPSVVSNSKWSTNGKTGRIKIKTRPAISDIEASERKENIRNILIQKGLCHTTRC